MSMTEDTESGEANPFEAIGEAAGAAFQQALADGANPADAFTAAAAAATEMADVLGIAPEISGPVIEAAKEAFDSAMAYGSSPQGAFDAAGDALREAVGEDGDLGDMAEGHEGMEGNSDVTDEPVPAEGEPREGVPGDGRGGGMDTLAGALGEKSSDPADAGAETTAADVALGAMMDASTSHGGAPADPDVGGRGNLLAPVAVVIDPEDEAEHGPEDVDTA